MILDYIKKTFEQSKEIKSLLENLGDQSLWRSHNRIGVSFRLMIDYIDDIAKTIAPKKNSIFIQLKEKIFPPGPQESDQVMEDIRFLLSTYREMALVFFHQVEISLLQDDEIKNNDFLFFKNMQNALDNLRGEWLRLEPIVVRSKVKELLKDEYKKTLQAMEIVVSAAAKSVGLEGERIVVVPGTRFSLQFFNYLENFAVLTVPYDSLQSTWDWSIFWHELAGYRVRKLKKDISGGLIKKQIENTFNFYKKSGSSYSNLFIGWITRNGKVIAIPDPKKKWEIPDYYAKKFASRPNLFGQKYLEELFSAHDGPDLSDLGNFKHQYERMLINMEEPEKELINKDWGEDWLEELFEDSYSVMAMREPFIEYFREVLTSNGAKGDERHPPIEIRITVAEELLKLMGSGGQIEHQTGSSMEQRAAKQILKFNSLLFAASPVAVSLGGGKRQDAASRDAASVSDVFTYILHDLVSQGIGEYIKLRSEKLDESKELVTTLVGFAGNIDKIAENAVMIEKFGEKKDNQNQLKASYEELLENKSYKELLDLPFYDEDFGFPAGEIANIRFGKDIKTTKKFTSIPSTVKFRIEWNNLGLGVGGSSEITFSAPNNLGTTTTYHTTVANWNKMFTDQGFKDHSTEYKYKDYIIVK